MELPVVPMAGSDGGDGEGPVLLSWKGLSVAVGGRMLLKNVDGQISGGFMAIMGPSGSGERDEMPSACTQRFPASWS